MVTGSTAGDMANNTTTKLAWTERAFPYLHLKLVIVGAEAKKTLSISFNNEHYSVGYIKLVKDV